ncbi:hypothetical protein [Methylobacterium iners]|jgi:hypothetical protein|uniref:Uncharacterized protein n=1 Tax=Methylobacterium iners TaxID=418707 RepID=A0ABQ4RWE4_9HYPH|nr:hypothetical protein [Methylobacterium iners]GJD94522.1 hypothetical protein OCOJLMKI_1725 [Methylobacterium iners]
MSLGTTELGYVNRNDQMVLRKPDEPGTDHLQKTYVLRCLECEHEYGAKGTDIPACCCPACDGGRPGLAYAA